MRVGKQITSEQRTLPFHSILYHKQVIRQSVAGTCPLIVMCEQLKDWSKTLADVTLSQYENVTSRTSGAVERARNLVRSQ